MVAEIFAHMGIESGDRIFSQPEVMKGRIMGDGQSWAYNDFYKHGIFL